MNVKEQLEFELVYTVSQFTVLPTTPGEIPPEMNEMKGIFFFITENDNDMGEKCGFKSNKYPPRQQAELMAFENAY